MFDKKAELRLYPHQEKILSELRQTMREHKRTVLMGSTGLGKTELSCQIIKNATDKGKKCCFVAHRINLVNQTSERFACSGWAMRFDAR